MDTSVIIFFFLMIRPPPRLSLFPSTPLFRSRAIGGPDLDEGGARAGHDVGDPERAADLHQLAARHDRCAAAGQCRRSEEHTSELQSQSNLVCRLLLEKENHGNSLH